MLPFENLGGVPEDTCLAEGICDELIHILGRVKGVRVTARTSSFMFRQRTADIRQIGRQLDVNSVIEGTLRRAGNRLRLSAQLINIGDGFQLWSERYDREVDHVFALQEDIAGAIASALRVTLEGGARTPAASFEAYERYLIGLHHWNRRSPQDLEKARDALTAALRLDPSFAPAGGALALCHVTFALYGLEAPAAVVPIARAAADRGLGLDPREPAALSARACIRAVYDWDPAGAERDFRTVIAASPSNATAQQWFATNLLAPLARFDEARACLARARELDPLSPSVIVSAGFVEFLAGDVSRGIAHCERALSLDPAFSAARSFVGPMLMAAGRGRDAVARLEEAAEAPGRSPEVLAALAAVHAGLGDRAKAEALLSSLVDTSAARFVSAGLTSMVRAALGDLDGAIGDMERAVDARAVEVIWIDVRPADAPLRADPRFAALLARRDAARHLGACLDLDGRPNVARTHSKRAPRAADNRGSPMPSSSHSIRADTLNRREFLTGTLVAPALACAAPLQAAARADLRRLGASTACLAGYSLMDAITELRRLGFDTLEMISYTGARHSIGPIPGFSFADSSPGERERVFEATRSFSHLSAHLPFHDVFLFSSTDTDRDAGLRRLREAIDGLAYLKGELAVLHIGSPGAGRTYRDIWQPMIETLRMLGDYAAERHLRIGIETMQPNSVRDYVDLIGETDHSAVGATIDTGHIRGSADIGALRERRNSNEARARFNDVLNTLVATLQEKVLHFHLSDVEPVEWVDHKTIGTGVIDFARLFETVRRIDYRHLFVFELEESNQLQALQRSTAHVRRVSGATF